MNDSTNHKPRYVPRYASPYTASIAAGYGYQGNPLQYTDTVTSIHERARRMEALEERSRRRKRRRVFLSFLRLCVFAAAMFGLYRAFPWLSQQAQVWKEANSTGPYPLFRSENGAGLSTEPAEAAETTPVPAAGSASEDAELLFPMSAEPPVTAGAAEAGATEAETEEDALTVWPERYAPEEDADGGFEIAETAKTFPLSMNPEETVIGSQYVVLLDAQTGEVLAERTPDAMINPASMTKVLTLLTAVEALESGDAHPNGVTGWGSGMDGTAVIDQPIRDYCWSNGCSVAGFERYERLPVRDLLYGCILPSGADACLALANFVDGSHEAFVARMNRKLEEMGLADQAHFTNCVGLYDPEHHCTVKAMATIMKAAMDNETCREVLGRRYYTTAATEQHPQGILLTNLFIRRIEDSFLESPLKVIGAKTGYVNQSGNCAVSYAHREDGKEYIVVTGMGWGAWNVIRDHTALYKTFCGG